MTRIVRVPAGAGAVLLLAACAGGTDDLGAVADDEVDRIHHSAPDTTAELTPGFNARSTVRVDNPPVAVDDVLVASLFPGQDRHELRFVGFDATDMHWQIETNPSCVGWVAGHRPDDSSVVTILDSDADIEDGSIADHTVATAFDPQTGQTVWGPSEVAGPQMEVGMVFGAAPTAVVSDEPIERTTLNVRTGQELDLGDKLSRGSVVYEHNGTALVEDDHQITAVDTDSGRTRWQRDVPQGASVNAHPSAADIAVIEQQDSADIVTSSFIRLGDGEPLGDTQGVVLDETMTVPSRSASVFVIDAGSTTQLRMIDTDDGLLWKQEFGDVEISGESASADRVYVELGDEGAVLDAASGQVLQRGEFTVPVAITESGLAAIPAADSDDYILATSGESAGDEGTGP